jgi:hypothetical protein
MKRTSEGGGIQLVVLLKTRSVTDVLSMPWPPASVYRDSPAYTGAGVCDCQLSLEELVPVLQPSNAFRGGILVLGLFGFCRLDTAMGRIQTCTERCPASSQPV